MPCRPHHWKEPEPGDVALVCEDCGRVLDKKTDLTVNMMASIVNSVELRRGDEPAARFKGFFGYGPLAMEYWT